MAASPRSDLDDFVNVSSPPGPSSPPKKAVPFSGGDRTTNLAVYEPDSTHVPKFKQAWNYRVMRAGGIDDYDLELQIQREREIEEAEELEDMRIKREQAAKKMQGVKVAPVDTGFTPQGYKQSLKPRPDRKKVPSTPSNNEAGGSPGAIALASPAASTRAVSPEIQLPGSPMRTSPTSPALSTTDVSIPPLASPAIGMTLSSPLKPRKTVGEGREGGEDSRTVITAASTLASTAIGTVSPDGRSGNGVSPAIGSPPQQLSPNLAAALAPLTAAETAVAGSAGVANAWYFSGAVAGSPAKASARSQYSTVSSRSPLEIAGTGVKPKKQAPQRLVAPVPTALPEYLGPNKLIQQLHAKKLKEAGVVVTAEQKPAEEAPVRVFDESAAVPLEAITQVSKPRPSQTLPIKKGQGVGFWEREGNIAIGMDDDEESEGSGDSSSDSENNDEAKVDDDRRGDFDGLEDTRRGSNASELETEAMEDHGEGRYAPYGDDQQSEGLNDDGLSDDDEVMGVREAGGPKSRASRWGLNLPGQLGTMVPKMAFGRILPWKGSSEDEGSEAGDGWSVQSSDDEDTEKPPFPHAEKLWFYDPDEWHKLQMRGKVSRVLCCNRCFKTTPGFVNRFWERYDTRQQRAAVRSEEVERTWRNWKKRNPYYYAALRATYYFLQRALTIATFVVNVYVIQNLKIGLQPGLAAAVAIMFTGQWIASAALMYRVTHSMFQHEVDEHHSEQLEAILGHFKTIYVFLGPVAVFVADWVIPIRFLFKKVTGDLISAYWNLRMLVNMFVSFGIFTLDAIITDALYRNPNTYRYVSIGPIAAGFVFNAMLFAMVMTEIYRIAKFHHQRLPLYMKEVLWGGINPLPHYTELRAGEIAEVDYEGCIRNTDDVITMHKGFEHVEDLGNLHNLKVVKIRRCWITDDGCIHIQKILKMETIGLEKLLMDYNLSLYENEIGDKGMTLLAQGMRANFSITHLDVSYNRIANQGFSALGELLQFNRHLRELRLDGNLADYEGIGHLTEGLTYTTGLSALSLNHVNVGEKGAIAFAEYYGDRRNTSLANLELIGAHINDAGITELGTTLKKCSFLQKLFLADNPITEAGTPAVGALFAHSPTLTSLDLGGMKWGDRGITPIMTALQTNKSLTLLDVSGNDLKMAVRSFVDILQVRNTTLQTLVIGANDIDEDYKKDVKANLGHRIAFQLWK